jgi:SSS family transporter
MGLNWLDYLVIAGYLIGIVTLGSYFARFQQTTRDYFLTDRSVPWWAVCFTIVATETSTLTFIGVPAEAYASASGAYSGNMTFLQLAVGYLIGRVLVTAILIPAYFRGELFTSYELLGLRFGAAVKNLAAVIFLFTRTFADGLRLLATALVIAVVAGVPSLMGIGGVTWTILVLGAAMIVYTVRGGVSAVIWTDVVQMFVYVAGALLVAVTVLSRIPGGWSEVVSVGRAAGKFQILDLSLDPKRVYTLWAGVFGGVALTLATHGTDQFLVQRLLSARSAADAGRGLVLSGAIVFAQFVLFLLIGVMLYVYGLHAPLASSIGRADQILPAFVATMSHGAAGFIVAAIVAAALSPSLNAMAATTVNDFYAKYVRPDASQGELMRISRVATIAWGLAQLAVAVGAQWMDQSVLSAGLSVLSLTAGPVLGAFLVGVVNSSVSARDMLGGMVAGIVVLVSVWSTAVVAWTWFPFVGAGVTSLVAAGLTSVRRTRMPSHAA